VLSELTSGEKIDIKNKIYNLRKKLELIEIEKQTIADYPFKVFQSLTRSLSRLLTNLPLAAGNIHRSLQYTLS
jgi:hypothetical protein